MADTWASIRQGVEDRLRAAGFETAGEDARWIVEEVDGEPTRRGVAAVDAMVARRLAGEPIQYVLGSWSFRTLDLFVDRRVLIPRPETEVVAGLALDEVDRSRSAPVLVADLGTGSGAIGLAIAAEREHTEVWLTDASTEALAVAQANLAGLGRAATRVTVAEGPWFEALPAEARGSFDVIVSNPPYIAEDEVLPASVAEWEPAEALVAGPRGTEDLEHLLDEALVWLQPGGALVLELAPTQASDLAFRARRQGFASVRVHPDLAGLHHVLVARA